MTEGITKPFHLTIKRGTRQPVQLAEPPIEEPAMATMPQVGWGGEARGWDIPLPLQTPTGEEVEARLRPDNTVWIANEQIGYFDPSSGALVPMPMGVGEQFGQTFQQMGMWGLKGLEYLLKPFEYFHEYVAVPFAMGVTAPGWGKTWWESKTPAEQKALLARGYQPGSLATESPMEMLKGFFTKESEFRKAYHGWEAPKYLKGGIELIPWFFIPPVARVASLLGRFGKAGMMAGKALEYSPYGLMEKGLQKATVVSLRVGKRVVGKIIRPRKVELPEFPPIEGIVADIAARHPERLATGKPLERIGFTSGERAKLSAVRQPLEIFKEAEVVLRADKEVRDSARAMLADYFADFGSMDGLFRVKEVPIAGTPFSHRMATASFIKPKTKGGSMALGDMFEYPNEYVFSGVLGQKARAYIQLRQEVVKWAENFRRTQIKRPMHELGFEQGAGYSPRRVIGARDPKTGEIIWEGQVYAAGTRPGAITPSFKPRYYAREIDGIRAGKIYGPEDEALDAFVTELYNVAMGERGSGILSALAKSPLQLIDEGLRTQSKGLGEEIKQLRYIQGVIDKVKQGWKPPWHTLRAVGREYPEVARAIRLYADKRAGKLKDLQKQIFEVEQRLAAEVEATTRATQPISGEIGSGQTIAIGSDPAKRYAFKFEAVEADTLICSHTKAFSPNPKYPKALQPRLRERPLARDQVERIARELEPDALLMDTHRLDSGSLIVAADNVVESGDGRLMAIGRAIESYPERYGAYRRQLQEAAQLYGLDPKKIAKMTNPILVRRRITAVPERAKFVREANESIAALMSPVELAYSDANYISEGSLSRLVIEGKESLTDALRDAANTEFVVSFLEGLPAVEKALFVTAEGGLSRGGIERIANAILAKAFSGRFGLRLAEWNMEAVAPQAKIVITGLAGSAGDLAKLGSAINKGALGDQYHIALDLAEAAERYIRTKAMGLPLEASMQPTLFEAGATPIQQALIRALDERSRSATQIRDFIRSYVNQALGQPAPGQALMPVFKAFGREELLSNILGKPIAKSAVLKPVVMKAEPVAMELAAEKMSLGQFKQTAKVVVAETKLEIKNTRKWLREQRTQPGYEKADKRLITEEATRVKALEDRVPTLEAMAKNPEEYLPRLEAEFPNIHKLLLDRGRQLKIIPTKPPVTPKAAVARVAPEVAKPPPELMPPEAALEYPFIPATEEFTLESLGKNIGGRLKDIRAEAKVLKTQYKAAMYRATHAAVNEGRIVDLPAWRNKIFIDMKDPTGKLLISGRDVAGRVMKIYEPEKVNRILREASKYARMGVTVKAALDLSWMFIQGMLPFGYDVARWATGHKSTVWLNGTKAMILTMFNPKYRGRWVAKNSGLVKEMGENLVVLEREAEFIMPGQLERMAKKVPLVGGFLGKLMRETYGRAGAGFSTGGLVARGTIYKQLRNEWTREGHSLRELGELANKLTGVVSSRELGVSATRRALESATLFAPRYTRAYLMVMRDLFRGTKTASEARKAMAGLLAGGLIAYCGLCTTLGQEPRLNPAPKSLGGDGAEFLAFKIGNSIIGAPGFWYSAIRMMAAVAAAAEQDPERLLSLDWRENDFLRWVMGRASPVARAADEIIEGKDYLGRRLDSPGDWFGHFAEYFLTIAAQNLVTRHPSEEEGKGKRFGAELLGLRAFPRSDWDKLRDIKDTYSRQEFDKPFEELNLEEKDKLLEKHPDYKAFSEEARERMVLEKGEDFEIWLWSAREYSDAVFYAGIEDAAQGLVAGQVEYKDYLSYEQSLRRIYRGQLGALNYIRDLADPERVEDFAKYLAEEQKPEDKALDQYWEIYGNPLMKKGVPDWDATERKMEAFLESLDDATGDYVLRNKDRGVDKYPPAARTLRKIQVEGREVVDEYYDQPEGKERIAYRKANPTVDAWLLLMGRVTVPQTEIAMQYVLRMLQERGLPIQILPRVASITTQKPQAPATRGARTVHIRRQG